MKKIGTGAAVKDGGLCRAVLDKCQYYTYENNAKNPVYKPYNDIVVGYVQRAMVNIKAAQSKIISDYAANCMNEVKACYDQQNTQITSWSSSASVDNVYKVLTGACYNVALTCGHAVFAYDAEMDAKIESLSSESDKQMALIDGISQIFYQDMMCPDNSEYTNGSATGAYVNDRCVCKKGYYLENGKCVTSCSTGKFIVNDECIASCPNPVAYASLFDSSLHTPNPWLYSSGSSSICIAAFSAPIKNGESTTISCQMKNGDYGNKVKGALLATGEYDGDDECNGSITCNSDSHYNVNFYNATGDSGNYKASLLCDGNSDFSVNSRNNAGDGWHPNLDVIINETCVKDTDQSFEYARKYIIKGEGFTSEEDISAFCSRIGHSYQQCAPGTCYNDILKR
jgi:hypothetical protein